MHHAWLIGIDDYSPPRRPLMGPSEDVAALATRLKSRGFRIRITRGYVECRQLYREVSEFFDALEASDTALIFFAGHAETAAGRLYLLGSDARNTAEGLAIAAVLDRARESRCAVGVVLDCCHAGMAASAWTCNRAGSSDGTALVLCATGLRSVAIGDGRHGLLTRALLDALDAAAEGCTLSALFDDARARCRRGVGGPARSQAASIFGAVHGDAFVPPAPSHAGLVDGAAEGSPPCRIEPTASVKQAAEFYPPPTTLPPLPKLAGALARCYSTSTSIRSLCLRAGLDNADVSFVDGTRPRDFWTVLVQKFDDGLGDVQRLVAVAREDYPHHALWRLS